MDLKKGGLITAILLTIILFSKKAFSMTTKTILDTNISEHISYNESVATQTGLPNVPNEQQIRAMRLLANKIFEPVRKNFNKPILVTSFFRSAEVNKAIPGSSKTSQHMKGEAMDIKATSGFTNADIFNYIRKNLLFDQLIWEHGNSLQPDWVHVSYTGTGVNRNQVLRAIRKNGSTVYLPIS